MQKSAGNFPICRRAKPSSDRRVPFPLLTPADEDADHDAEGPHKERRKPRAGSAEAAGAGRIESLQRWRLGRARFRVRYALLLFNQKAHGFQPPAWVEQLLRRQRALRL
eukprot:scaffold2473_cov247-Pinguiococcus_pyrenoidosus.AAC.5